MDRVALGCEHHGAPRYGDRVITVCGHLVAPGCGLCHWPAADSVKQWRTHRDHVQGPSSTFFVVLGKEFLMVTTGKRRFSIIAPPPPPSKVEMGSL